MTLSVNTNVQSLRSQDVFNKTNKALESIMDRISTGKRINVAKDDAAGLAISERMTAQIRGFDQALKNTNDGVSFLQTAESAMSNIGDSLQRMRELAIKGSNGSNSVADRKAIESEMTQLTSEINRVAENTSFNGKNLLNGSFTQQIFQIGANQGDTLTVDKMMDARASVLGGHTMTLDGSITGNVVGAANNGVTAVVAGDNFTITTDGGTSGAITYAADASAKDIATAINDAAGSVGVEATAENSATLDNLNATGVISFDLNGSTITADVADTSDLSTLAAAINGSADSTGVIAEFTSTDSKDSLTLKTSDGRNISIDTVGGAGGSNIRLDGTAVASGASAVKTGIVSLTSSEGQIITTNADAEVFTVAGTNVSSFSSIAFLDMSSQTGFQDAIGTIDAAIDRISSGRSTVGAYQNRFESVVKNITASYENTSAARGRIVDADMAREGAELTKYQILQQSSMAMLGQANSMPQAVLSLLR